MNTDISATITAIPQVTAPWYRRGAAAPTSTPVMAQDVRSPHEPNHCASSSPAPIPFLSRHQYPRPLAQWLRATVARWLARERLLESPVVHVQLRLERYGARAGIHWPQGATIREYAGLLQPLAGGVADALLEVVCLLEQAQYGGRELDSDQLERLHVASQRAWAQIRHLSRHPRLAEVQDLVSVS